MLTASAVRFVLNGEPVTSGEQRILERDLGEHGLDEKYWGAMNGLLTTRSRSDTPLVLRAFRGERLVALAHVMECRRTSQCFFPGTVGRLLDLVPTPIYYWTRGDAAVDLLGSPGFVAPGEHREAFYREAIAFLNRRYTMGCVMEQRGSSTAADCYETTIMDWGRYVVTPSGVEALLDSHKHLRRKLNRFRNKGGILEVRTERLDPDDRDGVLKCLNHSASHGLLRTPFQENYANMVRWAAESGSPGIVHLLARLDGAVVGYHTFLHSGRRLQCLSGGFDRSRHSTYHAYENILLEAMRYAEEHGVAQVSFGPVGNPSKAAVMPAFGQFVVRFYSRFAALRRLFALLIPRSSMRPEILAACAGLEARSAGASDGVDETTASQVSRGVETSGAARV